jgi:tRNA(Ile)-lysidine synthase
MADVRRAVREGFALANFETDALLLVACSGGADSLALAAAVGFEARRAGLRAGAVVVDHGLQPGSDEVAGRAAAQCRELGLSPVEVVAVSVREGGEGPEAAARSARYAALEQARVQHGAAAVLLAHSQNDQAETVLLGLTRGSGVRSIAGMQPIAGRLHRPLLALGRETLVQACEDQGLEYWSDPHNFDERFTRVRIRRLLSELEGDVGAGVTAALAKTAAQLQELDVALAALAGELEESARLATGARALSYGVNEFAAAPAAVRKRALQLAAQRAGGRDLQSAHLESLDALVTNWHGQKALSLPGITVGREGETLVFKTAKLPTHGAC